MYAAPKQRIVCGVNLLLDGWLPDSMYESSLRPRAHKVRVHVLAARQYVKTQAQQDGSYALFITRTCACRPIGWCLLLLRLGFSFFTRTILHHVWPVHHIAQPRPIFPEVLSGTTALLHFGVPPGTVSILTHKMLHKVH